MTENEKWAEKLSKSCDVSPKFLQSALEELSESCYGDAPKARELIAELTGACHFNADELGKFIKGVSRNCPMDMNGLRREIIKAEGKKEEILTAPDRVLKKGFQQSTH